MYGHLVPSSGGQPLPLKKTRMFLGRAKGSDAPLSRENAFCQLELIEGFWHLEDLNTPNGVKINGRTCKRERLMPEDEITIGRHRYRISFEAPKYAAVGKLAKAKPAKPAAASQTAVMSVATTRPANGVLGRLIPVGGGKEIPLTKPRIIIGRKPPCDVILELRSISSMHCGLELLNGYWQARDLDSRNGIRVNNVAVTKAWVLPKARLSLADHRYQLDYVGVGAPPVDSESESGSSSDQRSFMDKLGLSERDLERAGFDETDDVETDRRRWNLMSND